MLFDFERVPFSKHQRFTTLSMMGEGADRALYLRYVAGGDEKLNLGRFAVSVSRTNRDVYFGPNL